MLLYSERNSPVAGPKARAMLIDFYHRFRDQPLRRLGYMLRAARLEEETACAAAHYHHIIVNDDLEECVKKS